MDGQEDRIKPQETTKTAKATKGIKLGKSRTLNMDGQEKIHRNGSKPVHADKLRCKKQTPNDVRDSRGIRK